MKLKIVIAIVIVILVIATGLLIQREQDPIIKIGVAVPLTGNFGQYGQWIREGVDLAVDNTMRVYYEDTMGDPKEAVNAVNKLIKIDKVDVIIGDWTSGGTLAAAPIAEENKVPMIALALSPKIRDAGDYIFRNFPDATIQTKALAEFAKKHNLDDIATLYVNNDFGVAAKDAFGKDVDTVIVEAFEGGDNDFRTQLAKIKDRGVDAVFVAGYNKHYGLIFKQAKELGLDAQMLALAPVQAKQVIDIAGDAADGVVYTYFFDEKSEDPLVRDFQNKYVGTYGYEAELFAATAYDTVNIIKKAAGDGKEFIKNGLYKIKDFPGVTGVTGFDDMGDVIKPAIFKTIKNGTFGVYDEN